MDRPIPLPRAERPARTPELEDAPRAYTTRRVPRELQKALVHDRAPRAGDLVLARVDELRHHRRLHLPDGRRRTLFEGDSIVVAYAPRYAADQFEALVPPDLAACHLVASGGVAAAFVSGHDRTSRGPTRLTPLGLVAARPDAPPLNTRDFALPPAQTMPSVAAPRTIAVVGTAMNSGKTTAAAQLARGLRRAGLAVGYAKVTGTGAAGDPFLLRDAGASPVLDFTDVGHVSTHRISDAELEETFLVLAAHLRAAQVDVALLEIADGLLQPETAWLLESRRFRHAVDGVVLAAGDAMAATFGVERLRALGLRPLAVTGCLTSSPLQVRETVYAAGLPVLRTHSLLDPALAPLVVEGTALAAAPGWRASA